MSQDLKRERAGVSYVSPDYVARLEWENRIFVGALRDLAQNGTGHDVHPTRLVDPDPDVNEAWWRNYVQRMDSVVRGVAKAALDQTKE